MVYDKKVWYSFGKCVCVPIWIIGILPWRIINLEHSIDVRNNVTNF